MLFEKLKIECAMHSKNKGTIGEVAVSLHLIELGYSVFSGVGDNSAIDLIAVNEDTGQTFRIQVKSSTPVKNNILLSLTRTSKDTGKARYKKEVIDVFALYDLVNKKTCFISSKEALIEGKRGVAFRTKDMRGRNQFEIRNADDYLSFEKACMCSTES